MCERVYRLACFYSSPEYCATYRTTSEIATILIQSVSKLNSQTLSVCSMDNVVLKNFNKNIKYKHVKANVSYNSRFAIKIHRKDQFAIH